MNLRTSLLLLLAVLLAAPCFGQNGEVDLAPPLARRGGLGLGYGVPYGGLGLNADISVFDALAVTAGVGSYGHSAGYAVGVKYLHGSPLKTWRPQAILLYGINRVLVLKDPVAGDRGEAFTGFTAGLGSQLMFGKAKRHGLDFDVLFLISSGFYKRIQELEEQGYTISNSSRFTFSLGYRYSFDLKF